MYVLFFIDTTMKNSLFLSFFIKVAISISAILAGYYALALASTDYVAMYTPGGCDPTTMQTYTLTWSEIVGWGLLSGNTIYILPVGTHVINVPIYMNTCSVLVTDQDVSWPTTLILSGNTYITNNSTQRFSIVGSATNRLILEWTYGGILVQNSSWVYIAYTTLSGFSTVGGILLSNTRYSTITQSNFLANKYSIRLSLSSQYNTLSHLTINDSTLYGIYVDGGQHNTWINITISGTTGAIGIYLQSSHTNTFINTTMSSSAIGIGFENSNGNTFINTTLTSNASFGASIWYSSHNNLFSWGIISSNPTNLSLWWNAFSNTFRGMSIIHGDVGIELASTSGNVFSQVSVSNNGSGTKLSQASYNTFILTNNTNGIFLDNNSNYNTIYNKQILGQNNIFLLDNVAHNTISWGLFTISSTTSTGVTITLQNHQPGIKSYTITWAGVSGSYFGVMNNAIETVPIVLSEWTGDKEVIVIYTNGNTQYDSITLQSPSWWGGWGWGGWGWGGWGGWGWGGWGWGGSVSSTGTISTGTISTGSTSPSGGSIIGSPFSHEFNQAYLRAYAHGITTMPTIQQANMTGKLIRAHMAKMISEFVLRFTNLRPNTWANCTFSDIAHQSTEMKYYIRLACQLGIMGKNITTFRPNDTITRAEFGTILSRIIRWSRYEWGEKYYTLHLQALRNAGIITVTTPTLQEIKAYVMIMLKRTYEWGYLSQ